MNVYWIVDSIDLDREKHSSGLISQARTFASLYSGHKFFVSTTGKSQEPCSFLSPIQALKRVLNNNLIKKKSYKENNLHVFFRPFIEFQKSNPKDYEEKVIKQHLRIIHRLERTEGKIDLLHAHTGLLTGYRAYELSKILNIPYVITEHYSGFLSGSQRYSQTPQRMARSLETYKKASCVVAVSSALKNSLESFSLQNVRCIPNAVYPSFFKTIVPSPAQDIFLFFTLGRLHHVKGLDILFCSIRDLKEKGFLNQKKCHFYIGGASSLISGYVQESEYYKILENFQIEGYVTFLGYLTQSEAQDWYDKIHAYILPSRVETFGIPPAEAMIRGRPVIATRCGGPEDYVNETNGLLVGPNNPHELAEAIEKMIEKYSQYDPQAIRASIKPVVDPQIVFRRVMEVYKRAIGQ